MSADDMYELSFFIACHLNLYKNTTNIYGCGIFVQGNIQKSCLHFMIFVLNMLSCKEKNEHILQ